MRGSASEELSEHRTARRGRTSRQAELQDRILRVAERLFSEQGFESVTVNDIADGAGTSKGTVLYHFHSKDDLWRSTVNKIVSDYEGALGRRGLALGKDAPGIEEMVRAFAATCIEVPSYPRITALESARDNWRARWFGEYHLKRHMEFFLANFDRWKQRGELPDKDPLVLQAILLGSYQHFYNQAAMIEAAVGRDVRDEAFTAVFVDHVIALVRALADEPRPAT